MITDIGYTKKKCASIAALNIGKQHFNSLTHAISVSKVSVSPQFVGLDPQLLPVPVLHPLHVHQVFSFPRLQGLIEAKIKTGKFKHMYQTRRCSTRKFPHRVRSTGSSPAKSSICRNQHSAATHLLYSINENTFGGVEISPFQDDARHLNLQPELFQGSKIACNSGEGSDGR